MKRDMDLARRIMLDIEDCPGADGSDALRIEIEGYSENQIHYHVKLLCQAGLVEAIDASDSGGLHWAPQCLTWEGHDFLDKSRQEGIWQKAKTIALEKTGGLSLEVLKAVLVKVATETALG